MGQTAREVALLSLLKMQSQGFSNLVIDAKIKAANLNERDAAFATALFYGVLERMPTLDRIIPQIFQKRASPGGRCGA